MASILENEFVTQSSCTNLYKDVLKKFRKQLKSTIHLHLFFGALFFVELALALFSFASQTLFIAILASLFFASFFSYLILLFYFQARKVEQLKNLKNEFLSSCRICMKNHHPSIAESLVRFYSYLDDFEWEFYKISSSFISRFSAFCYWEDVFKMKQMLLLTAIDEYTQQIRLTPTNIEVHALLGSTYVALSKLYREPIQSPQHPRIASLKKLQLAFDEKSKKYSRLAIEEFKILNHYASGDPWIHEQIALGFKDLRLQEEETKETEILLKLRPQDKDILFRLGSLYFAQGLNAKGLSIYEELKKTKAAQAEELIASYGK